MNPCAKQSLFCLQIFYQTLLSKISPIGSRKHVLSDKISLYFHFLKELNLTKMCFGKPEKGLLNMAGGSA
ncbi:hypothetical protein EUGRSUZ_E01182 [Eucalyptus grandis]|uniref:Uncharacterized protein n=2 Tax=Eucalyptus grandis TaxID=71139 RepID=A0ACC3KTJ2_EUCGR|nr:hypothetical protein EUGRSUZ_E01182 [Eucalyptus grandis]